MIHTRNMEKYIVFNITICHLIIAHHCIITKLGVDDEGILSRRNVNYGNPVFIFIHNFLYFKDLRNNQDLEKQ